MKATGIVRRIDDLGRVVVPKEIRRTLRIREGDPLEIFTDRKGEIIFKKYSPIGELREFAASYAESMAKTSGALVCVTDCDHVIAASGKGKRDYEGKPLSKQMSDLIEERCRRFAEQNSHDFLKITLDDAKEYESQAIAPIICQGDAIGAVVLCRLEDGKSSKEAEEMLTLSAADFFGKQMEQ